MNSENLSLNGIQTSLTFKKHTSNPVTTLLFLTTISTGLTAPANKFATYHSDLSLRSPRKKTNPNPRSSSALQEPGLRPRRRRPERKTCFLSPIAQQNVAGHTIRRFCDSTGYSLNAPLEPTHFHKNLRNTVIDLAICKGMTITDVTSIPELSSDHNPVLFEVCLDNFTAPALSTYAFPNWKKFQEILTNSLPELISRKSGAYDDDFIDHVEEKIENYMDRNARRHTAPLTSPEEVMEIILKLNNKKAPGHDGIKNIALKPILTYGCAIWGAAGNNHLEDLQRLQNKVLRIIARAPRFIPRSVLHEELRVEPIHTLIANLSSNFHSSIPYHNNPTINSQNYFRNLPIHPPYASQFSEHFTFVLKKNIHHCRVTSLPNSMIHQQKNSPMVLQNDSTKRFFPNPVREILFSELRNASRFFPPQPVSLCQGRLND
ncbi:RNA-directed DNA polymerase from mobile element jockey [Trichonephila clavipes]|nr:RNA-directed DNA polymerase from mobile element jockey [Trichonephila clavipes]